MADWATVLVCFVTLSILNASVCLVDEPKHCSRFHYEEKLLEKVIRLEIKLEELESQKYGGNGIDTKLRGTTPKVAFRAMVSKDVGQVTKGQVIVFDQIHLNFGSAYGTRPGFFTAPYNGTYLFSIALGNPGGKPGNLHLKHNGNVIEYAFAGHTSGWNMGGVTTVAELSVDDEVWVAGEGYITGASGTRYHTSFSGGKPGNLHLKHNGNVIEYAFAGHTSGWNMGGVTTVAELSVDDEVWVAGEGYITGASGTRYHTSFSGVLLHAY